MEDRMKLIRACLRLMVVAILPACAGGTDDPGSAWAGGEGAGAEPPYEADIFLDFETGNGGDYYSAPMMSAMQKGTAVRWSTSRPLSHTKVRAENKPLIHPVKVGGVTYAGDGTRSMEFDLDEAIDKNLS